MIKNNQQILILYHIIYSVKTYLYIINKNKL